MSGTPKPVFSHPIGVIDRRASWTEAQRNAVLREMNRILEDPAFKGSKRCVSLFRRIVEVALGEDSEGIKERTLGIEVFGRRPDYDTGADPIVRMSANEIRKRLVQHYYRVPDSEVLIELYPGSYQPKFTFRENRGTEPSVATIDQTHHTRGSDQAQSGPVKDAGSNHELAEASRPNRSFIKKLGLYSVPLLAALALFGVLGFRSAIRPGATEPDHAIDEFWKPFFAPQGKLLVVVGNRHAPMERSFDPTKITPVPVHEDPGTTLVSLYQSELVTVNMDDASALTKISQFTGDKVARLRLFPDSSAELTDLREGPVVLLGAMNCYWTLLTTRHLRFHFERDFSSGLRFYIADSENASNKLWGVDFSNRLSTSSRDYALVARLRSQDTGQETVVIAGIGGVGTIAAADFLTDSKLMEQARRRIKSSDWRDKNIEIVLQIDTIGNVPTPPQMLAVTTF